MKSEESGRLSGKKLNELWGVQAKHAFYHRGGCWYKNLKRFPGALFDANGYVLFATELAYRSSPLLRVTKETNVRHGISTLPGYVKMACESDLGLEPGACH